MPNGCLFAFLPLRLLAALRKCAIGRVELQAQLSAWVPPTGGCGLHARAASPPARLHLTSLCWLAGWRLEWQAGSVSSLRMLRSLLGASQQTGRQTSPEPAAGKSPAERRCSATGRSSQPSWQRCGKESARRTGQAARGAEHPAGRERRWRRNPPSATLCCCKCGMDCFAPSAGCPAGLRAWCVCPGAQPSSRLHVAAQRSCEGNLQEIFHP